MGWSLLLLLAGCAHIERPHAEGRDHMSEGAVDTAAPAQVRFLSHAWATPDVVAWQAPDWCVDTYASMVTSGNPACAQTVQWMPHGQVMWTVTLTDTDNPTVEAMVLDLEPWGR